MDDAFKFLGWFVVVFFILYFGWYFSGGPQKSDSRKAFITIPNGDPNNYGGEKYGSIKTLDFLGDGVNE